MPYPVRDAEPERIERELARLGEERQHLSELLDALAPLLVAQAKLARDPKADCAKIHGAALPMLDGRELDPFTPEALRPCLTPLEIPLAEQGFTSASSPE